MFAIIYACEHFDEEMQNLNSLYILWSFQDRINFRL